MPNCGVVLSEGRLYIVGKKKECFWLSTFPNNEKRRGLFMVCKYVYNIQRQKQEKLGGGSF